MMEGCYVSFQNMNVPQMSHEVFCRMKSIHQPHTQPPPTLSLQPWICTGLLAVCHKLFGLGSVVHEGPIWNYFRLHMQKLYIIMYCSEIARTYTFLLHWNASTAYENDKKLKI